MWDWLIELLYGFLILLVAVLYNIAGYLFQIFSVLANTNIFENHHYQALTEKVYIILGVVMLFIMAYNFLLLVVDPDKNKGGSSVEKMIKNIVTSFILIVIMPSIFSFAFNVQEAIIESDVINKFFNSTTSANSNANKSIEQQGVKMAATVFEAFFVSTSGNSSAADKSTTNESKTKVYSYKNEAGQTVKIDCSSKGGCSLAELKVGVQNGIGFNAYKAFALNAGNGGVDFSWFVSLIAGGFLVYVILSFCFDLALRVCRLAFYQIISPITIAARVIPDNDIFGNWRKATVQTFISVFIRIFIMHLGLYLIRIVSELNFFGANCADCSWGVELLGNAFIIMGIIMFMKEASKLLDKIFGFGDVSLGIKEKLKGGGAFAAGAALGSGVTSMVRNAKHAADNVKEAKGGKAKTGAVFRGIGSTIAGGATGAYRGAVSGQNAGSWSETVMAASRSADETVRARDVREARNLRYRASGKNFVTGRLSDWGHDIKDWATGGAEQYDGAIQLGKDFDAKASAMESATEKMMGKFKSNVALVADMDPSKFKGSDDQVARYMQLYQQYRDSGMSLAAIEADIARQRGATDFASMVDKNRFYSAVDYTALEAARRDAVAAIDKNSAEFNVGGVFDKKKYDDACKAAREAVQEASFRTFDNDGYQAAIEAVATEHGKRIADLDSMYTQLWKESRLIIQDRAMSGDYAAGTKASDYRDIVSAASEFEELFKAHGSHVVDPDDPSKEFSRIDHAHSAGHTMDDIASAYKKRGKDAATQSARIRQQAAMRKDDKK